MHRILERQIKKFLGGATPFPLEWRDLLAAISDTYQHFDEDRALIERSLEVSSKELTQKFGQTQTQNEELSKNKLALMNLLEDLDLEKKQVEAKVEDRTKELKQESLLLESQNRLFNTVIANLPIGAMLIDVKSNNIALANALAKEILRFEVNDKNRVRKYFELVKIYKEDGSEFLGFDRPLTKAISSGQVFSEIVFLHSPNGGKQVPLRLHLAPVKGTDGKVESVIELIEDITKEYEIDKTKSEFVSLASHQLRTPLSSINWYTEMLESGDAGELNNDQKDFLKEIQNSARHMAELVTTLLNVSRIDMGTFVIDPEPANICELVTSELEQLKLQLEAKSLELGFECKTKQLNLKVDAKVFSIIMQNLLTNAIKYTPAGGKITVTINEDKKANAWVIAVADNGYGIPKEQQNKIFGKLFRADNVKVMEIDGNGLGLYMVKSIVENAGCKIWFESEEKQGTTFYVSIPNSGMVKKLGTNKLGELKS